MVNELVNIENEIPATECQQRNKTTDEETEENKKYINKKIVNL
jgi:hypothetical protein